MTKIDIIIASDKPAEREFFFGSDLAYECDLKFVGHSSELLAILSKKSPQLLILDQNLPGDDFIANLNLISSLSNLKQMPVLLICEDSKPE